jgi:hypothetical protein
MSHGIISRSETRTPDRALVIPKSTKLSPPSARLHSVRISTAIPLKLQSDQSANPPAQEILLVTSRRAALGRVPTKQPAAVYSDSSAVLVIGFGEAVRAACFDRFVQRQAALHNRNEASFPGQDVHGRSRRPDGNP